MAIDIYNLIFEILKVQPTGDFQSDFFRLIFFPHIVILIWLYLIARGPVFRAMHKGIGVILSLAIYIFIVYYGWYASIASLAMLWFTITIIVSLFYFMIPKFIHPGATSERIGLGKSLAKIKGSANIEKDIVALKKELRKVRKDLEIYQRNPTDANREIRAMLIAKEYELKKKIEELEEKW